MESYKITQNIAKILIEKLEKGSNTIKIRDILKEVSNVEDLEILKMFKENSEISIWNIAFKIIKKIFNIYRSIKKIPISLHILKIVVEYIQPETYEECAQYLTYISTFEELSLENNKIVVKFVKYPIASIDLYYKLSKFVDIQIVNSEPISIALDVDTIEYTFLEEFFKRILDLNIVVSEIVDLLIFDYEYSNVKSYVKNVDKASRYVYRNLKKTLLRFLENIDNIYSILERLSIVDYVSIVDICRSKIFGKLSKLNSRDGIIVESLDKLIKVNNFLIIWHC